MDLSRRGLVQMRKFRLGDISIESTRPVMEGSDGSSSRRERSLRNLVVKEVMFKLYFAIDDIDRDFSDDFIRSSFTVSFV
jgi:hypothetical protein